MLRYFYGWTPLVIVATIVLLSAPWLALIALVIVSLVALAALVFMPYMLITAMSRRWHGRGEASPRTAAVVAPAVREPSFQGIRVMNTTTTADGAVAAATGVSAAPAVAFATSLAAQSLAEPVVHISRGGVNR